jgi:hypothetical protein
MTTSFHRHLPHYHLPNATCFVTFRLAGSLPQQAFERLKAEYETERARLEKTLGGAERQEAFIQERKRYFARVDTYLDSAHHGPRWLTQPECAAILGVPINKQIYKQFVSKLKSY